MTLLLWARFGLLAALVTVVTLLAWSVLNANERAASEPRERSGAWGPRERARKVVRGTKSPEYR